MTVFPRVAIWDGTPNADYLRALVTSRGYLVAVTAQRSDVLVVDPTAAIKATSTFNVKPEDYGIKVPSVVRGKIAEEIQVKVAMVYQHM